ncbi:methylmalonyl-CoA mutase family protein [Streptomyces sp. GbtcB6]|uniref:methylmalonyl-CoA mutase family protein n=1 Tax=Streptomyces sp. GbtcB6 TaxID=2824751 RepID=UPI001C30E8BE|nr:methylmalonyl-CoA mutase family protein [Streptomyces sp. GbtcB6]
MGLPGKYPFDAGIHPTGYTTKVWTMRQLAGLRTAASTNERFRYLLGLGETGLSLAFDLPTQLGLDPDDPRAEGEVGRTGVSIATVDDLAEVFREIPLDKVSVSMTINATAPMLLAMWLVVAEESGVEPAALRGTLQIEMLKELLARKAFVYDLDTSMRYSLDVLEYCVHHLPGVNPVSLSGGHAREAGCTRALEVACGIADAETYLQGMVDRGLDVDTVARRFSFIFGTHMELLAEAAKFRVARSVYATRLRERWGAVDERAMRMRIQVNTFGSALAHHEPLNNVIRATVQAIAAVLGGVQSLHVCSFDEAHQTPGALGARIALRTQQILAHETDLARYVDPLGGSSVIDAVCAEMTAEVEEWLRRIDEHGGMFGSIRSGWLEAQIEDQAYESAGPSVGVTDAMRSEVEQQVLRQERHEPLEPVQRNVERRAFTPELKALRESAASGVNVLPSLIEAARARATIGQMRTALEPPQ